MLESLFILAVKTGREAFAKFRLSVVKCSVERFGLSSMMDLIRPKGSIFFSKKKGKMRGLVGGWGARWLCWSIVCFASVVLFSTVSAQSGLPWRRCG